MLQGLPVKGERIMAYIREEPVVESREVVREPATGLAGFAMVKYGFILAITIVLLYFVAKFILPMF